MRENRTYGSVRGVPGDRRPYRDPDNPRPAAPEGESTKAKYYRATKWLTVLIFRPLTGKSKRIRSTSASFSSALPSVNFFKFCKDFSCN